MQAERFCIYIADVTPLEDDSLYAAGLSAVSAQRREKIGRLRFAEDRRRSLGAGLLLQKALSDAKLPRDVLIAEGAHGKPYLPDVPAFHFSLSHSGSTVACAVGSRELGCDVQCVGKYDPRLAERFFSPHENAFLKAQPTPEQEAAAFFRLWTLKESYLKATGLGLTLPLSSFSVAAESGTAAHLTDADGVLWGLYELPQEDCCCACCICGDDGTQPPSVRKILFSADVLSVL